MILNFKVTVLPHGSKAAQDWYESLEFIMQFTEDFDNFMRLWFDNYPKAKIIIEANDT